MSPALEAKAARAAALMRAAAGKHAPLALASSLSAEDMVLTDMIAREKLAISVFTLETGRLNAETVEMIEKTRARYGLEMDVYRPKAEAVDVYVKAHGLNAFYESVELRKACCHIRKVEPLERALAGKAGWVTGQRREQAVTRADMPEEDWDGARGIAKYNPLAEWSWADVLAYAEAHDVPLNPLHARGYVSIGCDPCTRAIRPGEDPRAGRWWWEQDDSKECGLHVGDGEVSPI
jgi:phosphoadenosine phosphosulfate reductase